MYTCKRLCCSETFCYTTVSIFQPRASKGRLSDEILLVLVPFARCKLGVFNLLQPPEYVCIAKGVPRNNLAILFLMVESHFYCLTELCAQPGYQC